MNRREFVRSRRKSWRRFERMLDLGVGSSKKTRGKDLFEFSQLLRELSNDLAVLRARDWGQEWIDYLNNLVARGHNTFYRASLTRSGAVKEYLAVGFPRLFRANIGYFLTACVLFFGPLIASWIVVQNDPSTASRIIPNEQLEQYDAMYSDPQQNPGDAGGDADDSQRRPGSGFREERSGMFGFYVNHNAGIAFHCFARGVLLAVGTVYTLIFNGIVLGAVSGYMISQGHGERFLSFVVSHGSFELTAIAVAGGAGLMLGNSILHPGNRSIRESVVVRGLEAVQIALGAGVMLVVAAVIEAFWSPSGIAAMIRVSVGIVLWILVFLYLGFAGRKT